MTRRSIRDFTSEPVTAAQVRCILECAMNAPSAGNQQPWHFIVIDDRKVLDALPTVHPYCQMALAAPLAIDLPEADIAALRSALDGVRYDATLLKMMESRDGFVAVPDGWTDWRGPHRDGTSPKVPVTLPTQVRIHWRSEMAGPAMSGVAATETVVVVAGKDASAKTDLYRCFASDTGRQLWRIAFRAEGKLDSTNAPRATPVIVNDLVYILGAFGRLVCMRLGDGHVVWQRDMVRDLGGMMPQWGYCSTPLVLGDRSLALSRGNGRSGYGRCRYVRGR